MKAERIAEAFDVSLQEAKLALKIMKGQVSVIDHPERFPKTCEWVRSCFSAPPQNEVALKALDELLDTCGVEGIEHDGIYVDSYHRHFVGSYLNTGDTYTTTIVLDHINNEWLLTSWGDFYESLDLETESDD